MLKQFRKDQSGFSLIEMTIVLVVIGVLIGIVLKGQDLLSGAQMTALQSDIRFYQTSVAGFRTKYNALPGDFRSADRRFAGKGDVKVKNGNGNGLIDSTSEQVQFWQHLALGEFVKGIDIMDDPQPIFGETLPNAGIGGGFTVIFGNPQKRGARKHWLRLSQNTDNEIHDYSGVLTPDQALNIDKNMDDGLPNSGKIQSVGEGCTENNNKAYTVNDEDELCVLFVAL